MDYVLDETRLAFLKSTGLLDSAFDATYDKLTSLTAKLLRVPVALLSLVDRDRQFFKSAHGLGEPWSSARETPLSHSFCKHVVQTKAPLIVANAAMSPVVAGNLAIRDLGVAAYAGMPIVMPSGHVIGSFCAIDGQPREWTEEELTVLKDMSDIVNSQIKLLTETQSMREVLAVLAHDIKNPLTGIRLNGQLIKRMADKTAGTSAIAQKAERIEGLCMRTIQLVDTILDQSKMDSGKLELTLSDVLVSDLIEYAIDSVAAGALDKNIEVTADFPRDVTVRCDTSRIGQVLSNILGNAVKFSSEGKKITIDARVTSTEFLIEVTDQGPGIAKTDIPFIFDKFWQSERASRRGHGVGLSIARSIIVAHHGSIQVESVVGEGTRFHIRLPKPV